MLKSIGFIGYGFVGKACHKAFEHNVEAIIIDPKYSETTWDEFSAATPPLTFISLPAPTLENGSVDASLIYTVFQQLTDIKYKGLVVLRSTLPPAIVIDLYELYGSEPALNKTGPLRYVYSPEFLREAHWEKDATEPPQIIMAGNFVDCKELEEIYKNHSHIRHTRFVHTGYKTASLAKYAINCFLATKVIFMNQLYQLYRDETGIPGRNDPIHPETWEHFTDILSNDIRFGYSHLQVPGPDGQYGYGGQCFPKDIKAFIGYDKNERLTVLREAEQANTRARLIGDGKIK